MFELIAILIFIQIVLDLSILWLKTRTRGINNARADRLRLIAYEFMGEGTARTELLRVAGELDHWLGRTK